LPYIYYPEYAKIDPDRLFMCVAGFCHSAGPSFFPVFRLPAYPEPALTGKFFGSFRVAGNYRNQWPSISNAYTTATASLDFHVMQDGSPTMIPGASA
jgi:hypothetical protein